MTKIIEISNRSDMAYRIRKRGFYYLADWVRWNDRFGCWESLGHVGSSFDGYKTEANAMKGINRYAESLGHEIA